MSGDEACNSRNRSTICCVRVFDTNTLQNESESRGNGRQIRLGHGLAEVF